MKFPTLCVKSDDRMTKAVPIKYLWIKQWGHIKGNLIKIRCFTMKERACKVTHNCYILFTYGTYIY